MDARTCGDLIPAASTLTGEGVIVGTLHYMAPEQLEGRNADARSDLFAFGAVLYEMLTGKKAFDGPSNASIIAAVMEAHPPRLSVGGPQASRLERIVNKCLAKNPDERWQTARDLGDELRWLADDVAQPMEDAPATTVAKRGRSSWFSAGAAVLGILAIGMVSWDTWQRRQAAPAPAPLVQFDVRPRGTDYSFRGFDISDDGMMLAYVDSGVATRRRGANGLHVRRLDRLDAYVIPGTVGALMPRFSPDAQWIAYMQGGTLRKVQVSGDEPSQIVGENVGDVHGLSWRLPGTILIASADRGLRRIGADGGAPAEFTKPNLDVEVDHRSPHVLPDGRNLLVTVHGPNNRFSIAAQAVEGNVRRTIVESGFSPVYSPTGHLVFGRGNSILAIAFDATRLEVSGTPVALVERVDSLPSSGEIEFRLSGSGTLVYVPQQPRTGRTLTWVGPDGTFAPIAVPPASIDMPRLSPDGKQLAYVVEEDGGQRHIWTYEFAPQRRVQLTSGGDHWAPIWTLDGQALIYAKATAAGSDVMLQRTNGGEPVRLGGSTNRLFPSAFASDGRTVILNEAPPTDAYFFSQLTMGQPGPPARMPIERGFPRGARLSPDGRWISFAAFQGRVVQIFVQAYPLSGTPRQVSVDGGREPVWSRDGRTLFFRDGDRMFAVSIDTSSGPTWTAPRQLFEADVVSTFLDYDVAEDGRFVMIAEDPQERDPPQFNVVLNWASQLLTRVPVGR